MKISNYPKYDNLSQYLKTQEDLDTKLLLCRKVEESLFSQNNELLENTGTNDKKRIKNTTITNVNSNKSLVLRSTLMKQEEQKIQAKTIKTNIVKLNDSKDGQIMNVLKTENFNFFNTKRKESHSGFKLFKVIDPHAKTLLNEENKSKNSAVHLKTSTSNTAKSGISSENALSRLFKKQPTLTGQLKNSLAFSSNKDTKNKEINKQISNLESKILPTFLSNKDNLSIEFPKTNKSFLKKATFAPEYNSNISKLLIVKNTNERKINNYQTDNIINTNHIINVIETKENIRDEDSSEKKFSSRNITEQSNNLTNQNFSRLKKRNLNDNNLTKASKDLSNEINNSLDQETKVKGVSNSKTLISISENKNAITDKSVDITNSRCFERQKSKKNDF